MMLQTDGSRDWLQGRGEELTLIGTIDDDATNEVPYALFAPCETTGGYMKMLYGDSEKEGLASFSLCGPAQHISDI